MSDLPPDSHCPPPTLCAFEVELEVQHGPSAGERHVLQQFPTFVGRGADVDIRLAADEDDRMLSRRHLKISIEGGRIVIVDLSTNGTWVGQQLIPARQPFVLAGGEPVWLGPRTMIVLRPLGPALGPPLLVGGSEPAAVSPVPARGPESPATSLPVPDPLPPPRTSAMPGSSPPLPEPPSSSSAFPPSLPSEGGKTDLLIAVLGEIRIRAGNTELKVWPARKAMVLLATLVDSRTGRGVSADRLVDMLWPDHLADARAALQATVSRLRKTFRSADASLPDPIELVQGVYGLSPAYVARYDVRQFESLCDEAANHLEAGRQVEAVPRLEEAIALYRGPFLEGFTDDWVQARRRTLESRFFDALDTLAEIREAEGNQAHAVRLFESALEREPFRERSQMGLMRSLAASGRRDEALRRYHDFAALLRKEMNLAPVPEMVLLYESLRAGS